MTNILRTRLSTEPEKEIKLSTDLAMNLIKICEDIKDKKTLTNDPSFIEAKELMEKYHEEVPHNIHILVCLTRIAHLEGNIEKQIHFVKLQLEIEPENKKTRKFLRFLESLPKDKRTPKIENLPLNSLFFTFYEDLIRAIDSGDKELTIYILNQMGADALISDYMKNRIDSLTDLARSKKAKPIFELRSELLKLKLTHQKQ